MLIHFHTKLRQTIQTEKSGPLLACSGAPPGTTEGKYTETTKEDTDHNFLFHKMETTMEWHQIVAIVWFLFCLWWRTTMTFLPLVLG